MKYISVKNPKWANYTKTTINCEVNFDGVEEEFVLFTATLDDIYEHGKEIFTKCVSGDFGVVGDYIPPEDIVGQLAIQRLRSERDYRLTAIVDPVVSNPLRWGDLSEAQKQAWVDYRRNLLDITATYPDVRYVWSEAEVTYVALGLVWPKSPDDVSYTMPSDDMPVSEL